VRCRGAHHGLGSDRGRSEEVRRRVLGAPADFNGDRPGWRRFLPGNGRNEWGKWRGRWGEEVGEALAQGIGEGGSVAGVLL
jgi:hypothetical protein